MSKPSDQAAVSQPLRAFVVYFLRPVVHRYIGDTYDAATQSPVYNTECTKTSDTFIMGSLAHASRIVLENFEYYKCSSVIDHFPDGHFINHGEIPLPEPIVKLLTRRNLMNTTKKNYIREIKDQLKIINESLKRISEAEKAQDNAKNCREYSSAQNASKEACTDMMSALHKTVGIASSIGCMFDLYDFRTFHKIIEYKL